MKRWIKKGVGSFGYELLRKQPAYEVPPALESHHVKGCKVFCNRDEILEMLPKHAVCVEIGTYKGVFAEKILKKTQPKELHVIDFSEHWINNAKEKFAEEVKKGTVRLHLGDAEEMIKKFPDNFFDWAYVDADHTLEGVQKDLAALRTKMKAKGIIGFHDYISFDYKERIKYGVIDAVNAFCKTYDFEMIYSSLEPTMFNSVFIRKREEK